MQKEQRIPVVTLNKEQLECLTSTLRSEILMALMSNGPLTVAGIGSLTGHSPKSLYYPLRKLISCGLARAGEVVKTNSREEQLFDATSNECVVPNDHPDTLALSNKALVSAVAVALREITLATSEPESPPRDIMCSRITVRLTDSDLATLRDRLSEITQFIQEHRDSSAAPYSLTTALVPRRTSRPRKRVGAEDR